MKKVQLRAIEPVAALRLHYDKVGNSSRLSGRPAGQSQSRKSSQPEYAGSRTLGNGNEISLRRDGLLVDLLVAMVESTWTRRSSWRGFMRVSFLLRQLNTTNNPSIPGLC